jgi:hypothetical protein
MASERFNRGPRLTHNEKIELLTWFIAGAYDKDINEVADYISLRSAPEKQQLMVYFGLNAWDSVNATVPPLMSHGRCMCALALVALTRRNSND